MLTPVLHSQGLKISKCENVCPEWLSSSSAAAAAVVAVVARRVRIKVSSNAFKIYFRNLDRF